MDELCPLCLKMGTNSKIKAIQVNLEEALWMCENEECPWPFLGHDEPAFLPRKVGEKWAYEWQTYRRIKERIGSVPVSIELSLYTPPVTPSADASTKDAQSETAKNPLGSGDNTHIFSSNSSLTDSYAPRTAAEVDISSSDKSGAAKNVHSAKIVPSQYEKDTITVDKVPPTLPSIFDIDADDFFTDKISINSYPDSVSTECLANVLNAANSESAIDSVNPVLESISKPQTEKSRHVKREIVEFSNKVPNTVKNVTRPHIRSIAKTNIDLQRFDPLKIEQIKNADIEGKVERPSTPSRRKSLENIGNPLFSRTQQTTTINVDGIPPITLSYDLGDSGVQSTINLPVASTPIPSKRCETLMQDHDDKLTEEIPKIQSRSSIKSRRFGANKGKAFEKFSFSALKNGTKAPNTENTPLVIKSEPKVEDTINRNQTTIYKEDSRSSVKKMPTSGPIASSSGFDNIIPKVETLNSVNVDGNCSLVTETPAVDSLNLSCLIDDVFLDGYQNATQNLNDDWLESFFNENT